MGFWKDLMDATPGKTSARANELHSCGINSKIEIPPRKTTPQLLSI